VTSWRLEGEEPHVVESGEDLTLVCEVAVLQRCRGVFFGAALWSETDILVWAAASHDRDGATQDLDPGRYRLRVALGRVALAAGSYSVELSINTPEAQLDHWHATPALTVTSGRTSLLPERWQGLLDLDSRMALERAP
jgi:hypothetical protein